MKCTLLTSKKEWSKGWFLTNWTLIVNGREFLLGQDAKWISRVTGLSLNEFFKMIGVDDSTEEGRKKIAKWIVDYLELTPKIVKNLEPWELCC